MSRGCTIGCRLVSLASSTVLRSLPAPRLHPPAVGAGLFLLGCLFLSPRPGAGAGPDQGDGRLRVAGVESSPVSEAQTAEAEPEPAAAAGETSEQEELPSGEQLASGPGDNFRLYSHRNISLRARPNVGLRVPALEPSYSPLTADYLGMEGGRGPLFAAAGSLTLLSVDGERASAKAQELRDLSDGAALGLDLQYRDTVGWARLTGRHLGLDDQDAELEMRRFGAFSARLLVSEIPHNYAFGARSLYAGIGSGRLTIDDSIRSSLESSDSAIDAAERLQGFVDEAASVDLGHTRDRFGLEVDVTAADPVTVEITHFDERRQGVRPWSGSFSLTNAVEIPWPVDYDTENTQATVEYARGATLVAGSYRLSRFRSSIQNVLFDNPWRATDSSLGVALFSTYESGASSGLIDLYPDNDQHELTLAAVQQRLPGRSTLLATLSFGELEQDDALVPYTTNSAVVPGAPGRPPFDASDPANRPATSANARMDTRLALLRWISRPLERLEVKAHYRDWELENRTQQLSIPGFVVEDGAWRPYFGSGDGFTNLPIAHSTRELGLEVGLDLPRRTKLTLGYEDEQIDRRFREVTAASEDRYRLSLDSKPAPWADLRLSYLLAERRVEAYDSTQFFDQQGFGFIPVNPFLYKFSQAPRERDRMQLMASLYPTASLVLGTSIIVGNDDYPDSPFGVQSDEHRVYTFDLSYGVGERAGLYASYGREEYDLRLVARQWLAFGPGDPFRTEPTFESPSNWTALPSDRVESATLGVDLFLIPERLRLDLAYTYSDSDGRIAYSSPRGEPDLSPWETAAFEEVDDVRFYNFNPELVYTFSERASLKVGYVRETYDIRDFNGEGLELVPTTPSGELNGALFMGTLPLDYTLDGIYVELKLER